MASKYDPAKSEKTHVEAIGKFSTDDVDEDLNSVPGIGPAAITALDGAGITSTVGLIGKFLSLHEKGMSALDHCVSGVPPVALAFAPVINYVDFPP